MFHFLTPNYERILGKDRVLNQKIESRRMNLLDKIDIFFCLFIRSGEIDNIVQADKSIQDKVRWIF